MLNLPATQYNSSFTNNISWFTQLKAFSRSQNIPPTVNLLFMANKISFINLKEASSVEELLLNQFCSFNSVSF
jgi:hypothetical protein